MSTPYCPRLSWLASVHPREYARSRTAHPGETVVARAVLRPGRYRLVCTLANHDNLGQYGVLIVRQAGG